MGAKGQLTRAMTVRDFDNGYWYARELKDFAESLGIPSAHKLRKDELERAIKGILETGTLPRPTRRHPSAAGPKDVERGLRLDLRVAVYTNDRETKDFLEREAKKLVPTFKRRSGVRYRLNRWREEQLARGVALTYADLVAEYVRQNQTEGAFARIPHGRYINFMSDFLAAERGATRADAVKAWHELKTMDLPKDYRAWAKARSRTR
jgi:hypothetical protein